jgi:hypothetical protein
MSTNGDLEDLNSTHYLVFGFAVVVEVGVAVEVVRGLVVGEYPCWRC